MNKDYYSGFESEPEVIFRCSFNKDHYSFSIWGGYLDEIMSYSEPNAQGTWDEFAQYYHTQTGWYETDHWKVPNTRAVIDELESIAIPEQQVQVLHIKNDLVRFLHEALGKDADVYIDYQ